MTRSTPDRRVEVDISWLAAENQYVVTHHDVTDRYVLEQQFAYQAFHDELTALTIGRYSARELSRAAARRSAPGKTFAVMMIDLDDFKNVNDSSVTRAGDELLRVVADRLVECGVRGRHLSAWAATSSLSSSKVHGRRGHQVLLLRESQRNLACDEPEGYLNRRRASIGIAVSDGTADPADIERDADIALYDAKFAGKGQSGHVPHGHA